MGKKTSRKDASRLPLCKICQKPVPRRNNAVLIEAVVQRKLFRTPNLLANTRTLLSKLGAQHFLPTNECKGTPDLVRYMDEHLRKGGIFEQTDFHKWAWAYNAVQSWYGK